MSHTLTHNQAIAADHALELAEETIRNLRASTISYFRRAASTDASNPVIDADDFVSRLTKVSHSLALEASVIKAARQKVTA